MCSLLSDEFHCTTVILHVKEGNDSALQFYQKNGFKVLKKLTNYYDIQSEKFNAFVLRRRFDPSISLKEKGFFRRWWAWATSFVTHCVDLPYFANYLMEVLTHSLPSDRIDV
jgi:hypothetical protein